MIDLIIYFLSSSLFLSRSSGSPLLRLAIFFGFDLNKNLITFKFCNGLMTHDFMEPNWWVPIPLMIIWHVPEEISFLDVVVILTGVFILPISVIDAVIFTYRFSNEDLLFLEIHLTKGWWFLLLFIEETITIDQWLFHLLLVALILGTIKDIAQIIFFDHITISPWCNLKPQRKLHLICIWGFPQRRLIIKPSLFVE